MNKFIFSIFLIFSFILPGLAIEDEIANELSTNVHNPVTHTKYDYQGVERIPVRMTLVTGISSEKDVYDGQEIEFRLEKPIIYDRQIILHTGEIIKAKVQIVITPGMNGIPASIIFTDFKSDKIHKGTFSQSAEIFGQDRSLWVFPLKWALTILPPTGSLTNFILGGHVKVGTKKVIKIDYFPEWI